MHTPNSQWTACASLESTGDQRPRQPAWQRALVVLRSPVWSSLLATVCAAALLLAFLQVVHAGVQQGEARNRAAAADADAAWRCQFSRDLSERANCPAQFDTSRPVEVTQNRTGVAEPGAAALVRP